MLLSLLSALRLPPAERAKYATLGQMQSPVAIQLRQALALFCVPEDDPAVSAAACENLAVPRPGHCNDITAAIFY
jgi:hypothetical protein